MPAPTLVLDPDFDVQQTFTHSVIETTLGDNYICAAEVGMYNNEEYEVSRTGLTTAELTSMLATLKAYAGLVDFQWRPNTQEPYKVYNAAAWDTVLIAPNMWKISTVFRVNKSYVE